jgi:ATP dependent DNA ligase domain
MFKSFEFCLPTAATAVPSGPDWLHEIKYDGYRLRIERDGDLVRLFSRNGYDWSGRYPWIVEAARKIRQARFVLDGEATETGSSRPVAQNQAPAETDGSRTATSRQRKARQHELAGSQHRGSKVKERGKFPRQHHDGHQRLPAIR